MEKNDTKAQVISSLFWKFFERIGTQGIQFLVQIVLARLLSPSQFGTIAIVMVFINIAQVFVQSGFNTALIQKKAANETDFSSVFYLSLAISGILYIIIFFTAPFIADFYKDQTLIPVLRVLSLILFTGAFNSIQNAVVSKLLMFRKLFKSSLGAVVISGIVGIIMAYAGYGVWALVVQQLVNQVSITVIMWFTVRWRPKLVFSYSRVKELFSFGSKLLVSTLLNTLYMDLRTLIIGKIYSSSTLAYYNRGEQFPKLIVNNIDGSIQSVMLPSLSMFQDDKKRMKEMMRRAISTSSFIIFPMMIGMATVAEPLVRIVLTDKWIMAVPFLQIFCITYSLMPIHTANLQAINALGRSDIFLRLEIIKKIMGIIVLFITIPFGVYAIALGQIVSNIISSFINVHPNKKLLNYGYKDQMLDIMPALLASVFMGLLIYPLKFLPVSDFIILIVQVLFGIIIYVVLSKAFKIESFNYIVQTMKQLVESRKAEKK